MGSAWELVDLRLLDIDMGGKRVSALKDGRIDDIFMVADLLYHSIEAQQVVTE